MIKIPISIGEDDYLLWVETRTETTEAEAGDYDTPGVPAETRLVSCEIDTIKKWIDGAWIDVSLIARMPRGWELARRARAAICDQIEATSH